MKHDLNAINAAIALGDRVIPPMGCKIRYYDTVHKRKITGCISKILTNFAYKGYKYIRVYLDTDVPRSAMFTYASSRNSTVQLEILSIPENTPPFEEWERY